MRSDGNKRSMKQKVEEILGDIGRRQIVPLDPHQVEATLAKNNGALYQRANALAAGWSAKMKLSPTEFGNLARDIEKIAADSFSDGIGVGLRRRAGANPVGKKLLDAAKLLHRSMNAGDAGDKYALSAIGKIVECVDELNARGVMDALDELEIE